MSYELLSDAVFRNLVNFSVKFSETSGTINTVLASDLDEFAVGDSLELKFNDVTQFSGDITSVTSAQDNLYFVQATGPTVTSVDENVSITDLITYNDFSYRVPLDWGLKVGQIIETEQGLIIPTNVTHYFYETPLTDLRIEVY